MAKAQNGWPVIPNTDAGRAQLDALTLVPGKPMPHTVRVLAGDVAVIMRWLVKQYAARVEPINPAWCWGWNVREIEGSNVWSNHAAACALDLNAPLNPMGVATRKVMTAKQIDVCHAIERESDDVLRWGGDYVTRPDAMHWEIVGSRAAVRQLAVKLRADAAPPREVEWKKMQVNMPVLREGDDDAKLEGYNRITRIQRIVGADDDGVWGKLTTKEIAAWCGLPVEKCRVLTEEIYRKVFGLSA